MKFSDFIKKTGFGPTYVCHSLLYRPDSRPALIADSLNYKPTKKELMDMRQLISGKKDLATLFPELKKAS